MAATFQLVSKFQPAGDQPQAIEKLIKGFAGNNEQLSAWMLAANRAGQAGECKLYEKWKANGLKVMPQMATAFQPGNCK